MPRSSAVHGKARSSRVSGRWNRPSRTAADKLHSSVGRARRPRPSARPRACAASSRVARCSRRRAAARTPSSSSTSRISLSASSAGSGARIGRGLDRRRGCKARRQIAGRQRLPRHPVGRGRRRPRASLRARAARRRGLSGAEISTAGTRQNVVRAGAQHRRFPCSARRAPCWTCTASFRPSSTCMPRSATSIRSSSMHSLPMSSRRERSRQARTCAGRWRHPADACSSRRAAYDSQPTRPWGFPLSISTRAPDLTGNSAAIDVKLDAGSKPLAQRAR